MQRHPTYQDALVYARTVRLNLEELTLWIGKQAAQSGKEEVIDGFKHCKAALYDIQNLIECLESLER